MSITFPTLDLGDLGASLDEAIRADGDLAVEQETLPEPEPGANEVEAGAPATDAAAVADAKPEAAAEPTETVDEDQAYQARFEADYAERSKADIRKLQSTLDKRYSTLEQTHRGLFEDFEEARGYVGFLEDQLAEYDPDAVARFRRNRQGVTAELAQKRQAATADLQRREALRAAELPRLYPGVDPEDPELLAAFRRGDRDLELALIRERMARLEIAASRQPVPAAAKAAPASEPAPEPKAAPERDETGRFVAKAAQTRQMEQARGNDGLAAGKRGGFPAKSPTTLEEGRRALQQGFARLGIPQA